MINILSQGEKDESSFYFEVMDNLDYDVINKGGIGREMSLSQKEGLLELILRVRSLRLLQIFKWSR